MQTQILGNKPYLYNFKESCENYKATANFSAKKYRKSKQSSEIKCVNPF